MEMWMLSKNTKRVTDGTQTKANLSEKLKNGFKILVGNCSEQYCACFDQ